MKRIGIRTKVFIGGMLFLVLAVVGLVSAADPVDLNSWTAESYPAVSGFGSGVWTVSGDTVSVTQSVNGQPTMFYSDFAIFSTMAEGKVVVNDANDDDLVGFALGFNPNDTTNAGADYLLVDWKKGTQPFDFGAPSCGPGTTSNIGLAVSRVSGIPTADEFWGHVDQNAAACSPLGQGLTELARATNLGNVGWVQGQEYVFEFQFDADSLKVFVDGVLEISIVGSFNNGRLAFYNFSQADVTYSGFTFDPLVAVGGTTSFLAGESDSSIGAIVGATTAAAAVVALVAAGTWYTRRRRQGKEL